MGKRSKFGAKRTKVDGISFDSAREAKRYQDLKYREMAGEITNLRRQVPYELRGRDGPLLTPTGRPMKYKADFVYIDWLLNGVEVVEDAKGYPTPEYKIKRAVLAAQGVEVIEV